MQDSMTEAERKSAIKWLKAMFAFLMAFCGYEFVQLNRTIDSKNEMFEVEAKEISLAANLQKGGPPLKQYYTATLSNSTVLQLSKDNYDRLQPHQIYKFDIRQNGEHLWVVNKITASTFVEREQFRDHQREMTKLEANSPQKR